MSIQVTLLALAAECFAPVFASKRNIFLFLFWVLNFFRRFVGRSVSSIGQCALVGLSDDVGLVKKSWEIRFPGKPTLSPMFFQGADANLPILLAASAPPASCSAHWWKFGTLAGTRDEKTNEKAFSSAAAHPTSNILETTIPTKPNLLHNKLVLLTTRKTILVA